MSVEPVVVFRKVPASTRLLWKIRGQAQNLSKVYAPITRCDVAIEPSARHHNPVDGYRVRVEVLVPGGAVVVSRDAAARSDVRAPDPADTRKRVPADTGPVPGETAVHEAFAAAGRRLQDLARHQRGAVKRHLPPAKAKSISPGRPVVWAM